MPRSAPKAPPATVAPSLPAIRKRTPKKFDPARVVPIPVGRPTSYTHEIADYIVHQITNGRDLLDICDHDACAPARTTVYSWMGNNEEFRTRIAQARVALADHQAQRVGHLIETTTPANANAARVQLLGLQWRAAKLNPKDYSDRYQTMNHTGEVSLRQIVEDSIAQAKVIDGTAQTVTADPLPIVPIASDITPAKR